MGEKYESLKKKTNSTEKKTNRLLVLEMLVKLFI